MLPKIKGVDRNVLAELAVKTNEQTVRGDLFAIELIKHFIHQIRLYRFCGKQSLESAAVERLI